MKKEGKAMDTKTRAHRTSLGFKDVAIPENKFGSAQNNPNNWLGLGWQMMEQQSVEGLRRRSRENGPRFLLLVIVRFFSSKVFKLYVTEYNVFS